MSNIHRFHRRRLQRKTSKSRSAGRLRWQMLLLFVLAVIVASIGAASAAGFAVYQTYRDDLIPPQNAIQALGRGASRVYARDGQTMLYEFVGPSGGVRRPVPLENISPYLIYATIATEDASFYENPGVNFKGMFRAAWENLTPFGPGLFQGSGGSSITQQLVKNIYIKPEERFDRRIQRKLKETVLALELKKRYDNDQILEWYLNQVDYGNFAFGAEAAAQRYFGKSARDLTLAEAALLAGIPQAPGLLTPALPENQERSVQRQKEVLDLMLKHIEEVKSIVDKSKALSDEQKALLTQVTPEQLEGAKAEPLTFRTSEFPIEAPHFVFYVQEIIDKMCQKGVFTSPVDVPCDKTIFESGLNITTTLDLELQHRGEAIVEEIISANEARYNGHNGAAIALNPNNGEILAMVGSRNYFNLDIQGNVNIATSLRSHGSTMKVFSYLTAFKQGWVPSTIVNDSPLVLGDHKVNNWNFSHLGAIPVRKALAESVNVAAVRTAMDVGIENFIDTAHQMGITDLPDDRYCGPTITLGSCEVKLIDMTFAYATIANNGLMKGMPTLEDLPEGYRNLDPVAVLKIQDDQGNVLYEDTGPQEEQVIRPAYAYMITHILHNDAIRWSSLTLPFPAAAKTGTSEDFKDNVLMGFNPGVAIGVWMGNADGTPMADRTFSSAGAGPMWRAFMQAAFERLGSVATEFSAPGDVALLSCGGRQEVFVKDETPKKTGVCRAPGQQVPVFPSPTATPTPAETPTPAPTETAKPTPPSGSGGSGSGGSGGGGGGNGNQD